MRKQTVAQWFTYFSMFLIWCLQVHVNGIACPFHPPFRPVSSSLNNVYRFCESITSYHWLETCRIKKWKKREKKESRNKTLNEAKSISRTIALVFVKKVLESTDWSNFLSHKSRSSRVSQCKTKIWH